MPFRVSKRFFAGGFLLALAGCYSYPQQYGPGGYYGQPPGGGRMMAPQQAPNLGSPTLAVPENADPGQTWQPGQPSQPDVWDPKTTAPKLTPGGDGPVDTQKNAVPDPTNLDVPDLNQANPQNSPDKTFDFDEKQPPPGNGGTSYKRESGDSFLESDESGLKFEAPVEVTQASSSRYVPSAEVTTSASGPNPYDYDRKEYRSLQGVVEYVEFDKAWHIMYSAAPESSDRFGGDIALKDHPGLKGLQKDDVIYVEGHVDPQSRTVAGKPRYQIDHMQKLVPKQK